MEAGKQRETIVPDKENRDSKLYLRTEYARIKHWVHVHIPRHSFTMTLKQQAYIFMQRLPASQAYPIRLIHRMIREV